MATGQPNGVIRTLRRAALLEDGSALSDYSGWTRSVVVVEHDMAFVREIAERITVLHLGQVLAEGSVEEIENNPRVREAYLGSKGIS